jgi:uncharacterized membrane protein
MQIWIFFTFLSAIGYFTHDLVLKQVSNKFDSTMASLLLNFAAFLSLAIYGLAFKPLAFQTNPWLSIESLQIIVAGVFLAIASVSYVEIFTNNGQFSLAIPLLYVSIIFLGAIAGVVFYKDMLNPYQIAGISAIVIGIILVTRQ